MATEYEKAVAAAKKAEAERAEAAKSRIPTGGTEAEYNRLIEQARQLEAARSATTGAPPPATTPAPLPDSVLDRPPDLPKQDLAPGVPGATPTPVTLSTQVAQPNYIPTKPETRDDFLSVQMTSNPDKFIVRTQIPGAAEGLYTQGYMTRDEIIAAGGEIPVHLSWGQGAGKKWTSPEAITESDIRKAYKDMGLDAPDFATAPREIVGLYDGSDYKGTQESKANVAGLAGYLTPDGIALYSHPSQYGGVAAALARYNTITDKNARADYAKAFKAYFGTNPDNVAVTLPGVMEEIRAELGLSPVAFKETIADVKKNPDSDEFAIIEDGGTITIEQKSLLFSAAGVSYNAQKDIKRHYVTTKTGEIISGTDYENIKKESPELARILMADGFSAYTDKVKEIRADEIKAFEKSLDNAPPELKQAYEKGGIEAYSKALGAFNAKVELEINTFIDQEIKPDSYLNSILKSKGEDAAIAAYEKRHKDIAGILERNYTKLPDDQYVLNKDIEALKKYNTIQYETLMNEGVGAYKKAMTDAEKVLAPYLYSGWGTDTKTYNIYSALDASKRALTNDKAGQIYDAIQAYFGADALRDAIQEYNKNQPINFYTEGGTDNIWGWKQITTSYNDAVDVLPAGLVALATGAKSTSIPHDDFITTALIIAAAGGIAGYNLIKNYINKNKTLPKAENTYAIIGGMVVPLSQMDLTGKLALKGIEQLPGTSINDPKLAALGVSQGTPLGDVKLKRLAGQLPGADINDQRLQELTKIPGTYVIRQSAKDFILQDPTDAAKVDADDFVMKAQSVATAAQQLGNDLDVFEKVLADYPAKGDALRRITPGNEKAWEIYKSMTPAQLAAITKYRNAVGGGSYGYLEDILGQGSKQLEELFESMKAHDEFLAKLALYKEAWKSYVASLDPAPASGKSLNEAVIAQLAALSLSQQLGKYEDYVKAFNKAHTEAITSGVSTGKAVNIAALTAAQSMALENTSTNTKISQGTTTTTDTGTATKAATQPAVAETPAVKPATATQTATKTATKTAEAAQTSTQTASTTTTATKTATAAKTATQIKTRIKIRKGLKFDLPDGASDKEKRDLIKNSKGAVVWNMGKLSGRSPKGKDALQDVWHVRIPPYGDDNHIVVKGKAPDGATVADGPGSAYKTAQALGGKVSASFTQGHGAFKAKVTGGGKGGVDISFKRSSKGHEDVSITGDNPRGSINDKDSKGNKISDDTPAISPKGRGKISTSRGARITPPRRRIR